MNKFFWIFIFLVGFTTAYSQQVYKITYEKLSNNVKVDETNPIVVWANQEESILGNLKSFESSKTFPYEITEFEKGDSVYKQSTFFSNDSTISTINKNHYPLESFKKTNKTKRILGIKCKHAEISINSNHIDLWYIDHLNIYAAPNAIGFPLGLIMEYERNNNFSIRVNKIEELKNFDINQFTSSINENNELLNSDYQYIIWKNKFITIPVFEQERINFSDQNQTKNNVLRFANGTVIVKKVKFPKLNLEDHVFLDLKQFSDGDAYDRTGSVFIIPINSDNNFLKAMQNGVQNLPIYTNGNGKKYQGIVRTETFEPTIELMRFFTSFGIKKFNYIELKDKNWLEETEFRQDITEFNQLLSDKEVYIGAFIGNYDKGGHIISAEATIHKGGKTLMPSKKVIPVYNTLNILEMAGQEYGSLFDNDKGLLVEFDLKEDVNNAQLRYITTGHGGWENGDEFVPKQNFIYLDDKEIFNLAPWKTDCGSYRNLNPASGNFENGLSSSDYSRSNWCPGTITNPYYISLGNLKAGKHKIQVKIPQGKKEGNSFSFWSVSGVILGE